MRIVVRLPKFLLVRLPTVARATLVLSRGNGLISGDAIDGPAVGRTFAAAGGGICGCGRARFCSWLRSSSRIIDWICTRVSRIMKPSRTRGGMDSSVQLASLNLLWALAVDDAVFIEEVECVGRLR